MIYCQGFFSIGDMDVTTIYLSRSIPSAMKPTRLYIKKHNITGMSYLGKTTRDPYTYHGSGLAWKKHISLYGKEHIITTWVSEVFTDRYLLVEFAIFLSAELDVVKSDKWANLILENGVGGGDGSQSLGKPLSDDHRKKVSNSLMGVKKSESHKQHMKKPKSEESKRKSSETQKGRKQSPEHIQKLSEVRKGRIPWNKGKTTPADVCKKISDSCRGRAAWNKGITDTKTKTNGDIDGK